MKTKAKPVVLSPEVFSRAPLERMLKIHHAIQFGSFPNANDLARALEVSPKSVHRDVEFMRERLDLPIGYDRQRFGYYYTEEVSGFPTVQLTEGELFALLVAEKALQQYRGTNFEKPLLSAFKKMAASLPDTVSLNLSEWEDTISFRTTAEPILNLEVFDSLARASSRRQQIRLRYRKPGQSEPELRTIDPYHLTNINGEWFLFAFCHLRNDIRTFVPARIQSLEATGATFERPADFSLERTLRDSFGIHSAEGDFEIRILFDDAVADYIREKKWHASQSLADREDGSVELTLRLSSLAEVKRWILGWADHAMVLSPPQLVDSLRRDAQRIAEKYAR